MTETNKDGIIFLDKPAGQTSFEVLGSIKRTLQTGKVGHTGTLDKFAEGLLIVLTGRLTRLNSVITGMDKVYEAAFRFGMETETLDPEGAVVEEAPVPDEDTLRKAVAQFVGPIRQQPPLYSAVHINGRRAHEMARKGETPEIPYRDVVIHSLDILSWDAPFLRVRVHCSKGTYIRSLARDLGKACGSRAYVTKLNRVSVGPFSVSRACRPADFSGREQMISWEEFFPELPDAGILTVRKSAEALIANGVPFRPEFLEQIPGSFPGMIALKGEDGALKAVIENRDGTFRYRINLN